MIKRIPPNQTLDYQNTEKLIFCESHSLLQTIYNSPVLNREKDHLFEKGFAVIKETITFIIFEMVFFFIM